MRSYSNSVLKEVIRYLSLLSTGEAAKVHEVRVTEAPSLSSFNTISILDPRLIGRYTSVNIGLFAKDLADLLAEQEVVRESFELSIVREEARLTLKEISQASESEKADIIYRMLERIGHHSTKPSLVREVDFRERQRGGPKR